MEYGEDFTKMVRCIIGTLEITYEDYVGKLFEKDFYPTLEEIEYKLKKSGPPLKDREIEEYKQKLLENEQHIQHKIFKKDFRKTIDDPIVQYMQGNSDTLTHGYQIILNTSTEEEKYKIGYA